jgi:tetratricopeptide (TPR) repeat protein
LVKAKRYYRKNDVKAYLEIKSEMKAQDVSEFTNILIKDVSDTEYNYISGKSSYEDAINRLDRILMYGDTAHISNYAEVKQNIEGMHKSREAYENGITLEESGDYENAYENFDKVIESDNNYQDAQKKMEQLKELLRDDYKEKAELYVQTEDYENAILMLNKAKKYDESDSSIEELLSEYKKKQEEINKKQEEAAREKAMMAEGKVIKTSNMTATFKSATITDHIYPDNRTGWYSYYSVGETGTTWMDLNFKVKNTGAGILNLYNMVESVKATYDEKYSYSAIALYSSSGKSIDRIYQYFSHSIDPLQEVTLHIVIALPVEVKTSGKSLEVELVLDGERQILIYQ